MTADIDLRYMRRALQLAANGRGHVSPNPMVGAVIVDGAGRIIGEGWHRRYGGHHAEVNAVRSVADADKALLPDATIYVTLEPCSHYGKTPPCAKLLIDIGIGRVVTGAGDPNPKVAGRGIAMLRRAGIEVIEHVMEAECRAINRPFMTAHTLRRPFVTLKWACSADGFMDCVRRADEAPARFSDAVGAQTVHWRRACHDAIAVGAGTVLADNPRLDVRHIYGSSPRPVVFDRHRLTADAREGLRMRADAIFIDGDAPLADVLHTLYSREGITSLLVEGGASLLGSFISSGCWDEAFVEVSARRLGAYGRVPSPVLPTLPTVVPTAGANTLLCYQNMI